MNKTELKNFAVSARRDLLEKVALRAKIFGVDEKSGLTIEEKFGQLAINGETYPIEKKTAFLSLKKQLDIKGYEQLMEEVAYTWFNRIIAIRYMEVNEYLPEKVNILSSSTGKVEPDILSEFETMDLDIDSAMVKDLIRQGDTEDAYRNLFIAQCNALYKILPFMFEKIHDYTELLLPDFLLDSESVINKLVSNQDLTEDFTEVEVIGWLYQFYNTEPKDKVFANLKKKKKVEKHDIPAATQLFTPKWIVQYMVENSLGQLWLESNPNSLLKKTMRYYIEPVEQNEEANLKLEEIRYKNTNLEEIRIIDPCVGSGHILVYAFDLLYQMYEEAGYPSGDIPQLILEKNLYGLDIDDRAAQLAAFALLMKARGKSRRIFRRQININVFSIQESNELDIEGIKKLLGENDTEQSEIELIINTFINAKNFGSILRPPNLDYDKYLCKLRNIGEEQLSLETYTAYEQLKDFKKLIMIAKIMASKYDIVATNPPYMGIRSMNSNLTKYLKDYFPNNKGDLSTVLMERSLEYLKFQGFTTMINIPSWMFLSSYEYLRKLLISNTTIYSLVHLGRGIFGADFGTVSFVFRKTNIKDYIGTYKRLIDKQGEVDSLTDKEKKFHQINRNFLINQSDFVNIPGYPIAYWASNQVKKVFKENPKLGEYAEPRQGMKTSDNDRFIRLWHEISWDKVGLNSESLEDAANSNKKWFPYNKGGVFRKWYGNQEYVVNWENGGQEIIEYATMLYKSPTRTITNMNYYFKPGITWTVVSSASTSFRYTPSGFLFSNSGSMIFSDEISYMYLISLLNTKIIKSFLSILSPTVGFESGYLRSIPLILPNENQLNKIEELAKKNVNISKRDWDSFETSWEFKKHPLLDFQNRDTLLSSAYNNFENFAEQQFVTVKANEELLNSIFIELYGLKNELGSEIPDDEITYRKTNRNREAKSFLSYFIGNVVGRYSLDYEGIIYAGGKLDNSKYETFIPNQFGLIQLTDEYYFEDDIIARLREFLSVIFGTDTIEENLHWLAESLELKRNETTEERLRRYFLDEFFNDHCQVYQKRPIYWLVDSGKQKGLRTLVYMHRYQPDTMATVRFEHLQEIQAKYNNEIAAIDLRIVNPNLSATEKRDLEKRKIAFQKRLDELLEFDKNLAKYANSQIEIDLDDGVKVNYDKFDKVLAKIK